MKYFASILIILIAILNFESLAQTSSPNETYEEAYDAYDNFKYKKALKLFESVAPYFKDSIEFQLIHGICLSEIGKNLDAIKIYNSAIKLNPDFEQIYIQRGISYFAESENSKAIKDFKQAILLNPDNPEAYLNLGTVKYDSGDQYGACKEWRRARDLGMQIANQMIKDVCK